MNSWKEQDIEAAFDTGLRTTETVYLERSDGKALIYPGKTHSFVGKSESLKSWAALFVCADALMQYPNPEHVVYIDFEDTLVTFLQRLTLLGVPRDVLATHAHYIRPEESLSDDAREYLTELMDESRPTVCVVDGVTEAIALEGLDPDKGKDIARWVSMLPRFIAHYGPASILIDHTPHDRDREIGLVHKRNAIDGAVFMFKSQGDKFGPSMPGRSTITVEKDRPGTLRGFATGKHIGTLLAEATDGTVRLSINPPAIDDDSREPDHDLLQRVVEFVPITRGVRPVQRRRV